MIFENVKNVVIRLTYMHNKIIQCMQNISTQMLASAFYILIHCKLHIMFNVVRNSIYKSLKCNLTRPYKTSSLKKETLRTLYFYITAI